MNKYSIKDKSIVIFGFGMQGKAHALNLKESGHNVTVCLPEASSSIAEVKSTGIPLVTDPVKAARIADIAVLLVPDSTQASLYKEIEDFFPRNSAILFAHGLNIHYKMIDPREDLDVILVAPLAHGHAVRKFFIDNTGLPVMIGVKQNVSGRAWQIAREYAKGIGATGERLIETTFSEETETDLFVEQTLICGGLWRLITSAFETLIEEGYNPEIAYFSCLKEVKILSDLFANFGILGTFERISDPARYGALSRGPRIIGESVKSEMKKALGEIRSGKFIEELAGEMAAGEKSKTVEMMQRVAEHTLETLHKRLRDS